MKTTLLSLALAALGLFSAATATAQAVPNGTFETWATRSTVEVPQSWTTVDEILKKSFSFLYTSSTTTKNTDRNSGSFAARMETKNDPLASPLYGPLPGGVLLGSADLADIQAIIDNPNVNNIGGLPFTTRAARMDFYYKLAGANALSDSAFALVSLTRKVGTTVQTIATGGLRLLPAANYTLGSVPLVYTSALTPDTIRIAFVSGLAQARTAGTVLFVDDVVMTGTVAAARNPALEAALTVYPNPGLNGEFQLASPAKPAVATAPYTVTDATGQVVRKEEAAPASLATGRPLKLAGLPAGVYLLQLHTPEGPLTRKLLIP